MRTRPMNDTRLVTRRAQSQLCRKRDLREKRESRAPVSSETAHLCRTWIFHGAAHDKFREPGGCRSRGSRGQISSLVGPHDPLYWGNSSRRTRHDEDRS
jgi:hypothetical protein